MSNKTQNIDNKLPVGWDVHALSSLVKIVGGGTPSKSNASYYKGSIHWATVRDLNVDFLKETELSISEVALKNSSTNIIPKGNIIIATRVGLGKIVINEIDVAINQDLKGLISNEKIERMYLYHWFQSISNFIIENGTGATVKGVKLDFINSLSIPLPLISEQKKIVNLIEGAFEKIDKSISLLEQSIKKIEELNESVLAQVFGGVTDKYVDFQEVAKIIGGGTPSKANHRFYDGEIFWASVRDLNVERLIETQLKITDEALHSCSTNIIPKNNLIIATRVGLGKVVLNDVDTAINQDLKGILPNSDTNVKFVFYWFKSIANNIIENGTGATVKGVKLDFIKKLSFPVLRKAEQIKVVKYLDKMHSDNSLLLSQYQNKLNSLKELKQSILDSAFKGQLRKEKSKQVSKETSKFQRIAYIYTSIYANQQQRITQGEMAIAKDLYLVDTLFGANTGFQYKRHNWGAFDPEIKRLLNTKQYFERTNYPNSKATFIDLKDKGALLKDFVDERRQKIQSGIKELNDKIFSKLSAKDRPHKKELLATVLMCMKDCNTNNFEEIRTEMASWKTPKQSFKNKAEKFNEKETAGVIKFIVKEGWDKKVII
jgi:type I restriction enzyme S subunit